MRLREIIDPLTASAILPRDAIPGFQGIIVQAGDGIETVLNLPDEDIPVAIDPEALDLMVRAMTRLALDHCVDGDAVRLWMRTREDRALLVIDFTGTQIPEDPEEDLITGSSGEQTGWRILSGLKLIEFIADEYRGVVWSENTMVGGKHVGGLVVVGLHLAAGS